MNHYEKMAKKSVESRGLPYYGNLKKKYPIHWSSFINMHKRSKLQNINVDEIFLRNRKGFENFIEYLGNVPSNMKRPSIGRIDHSLGYIRGNFMWEELSDNSRDAALRNPDIIRKACQNSLSKIKSHNMDIILSSLSEDIYVDELKEIANYNHRKDVYKTVRRFLRKNPLSNLRIDIKNKMISVTKKKKGLIY